MDWKPPFMSVKLSVWDDLGCGMLSSSRSSVGIFQESLPGQGNQCISNFKCQVG